MKDGFIKVCAATIDVSIAGVSNNTNQVIEKMKEASTNNAKIVVFPELTL